jgi:hypothetical protein
MEYLWHLKKPPWMADQQISGDGLCTKCQNWGHKSNTLVFFEDTMGICDQQRFFVTVNK